MKLIRRIYEKDSAAAVFSELRTLKDNCSTFLKNKTPLFRATNHGDPEAIVQQLPIRTDRRPLHTEPAESNFYDVVIDYLYQSGPVRRRSCYASNRLAGTEGYGDYQLFIFPIDRSEYLYNPIVADTKSILEIAFEEAITTLSDEFNHGTASKCELLLAQGYEKAMKDLKVRDRLHYAIHAGQQDDSSYISLLCKTVLTTDPEELKYLTRRVEVAVLNSPHFYAIEYEMMRNTVCPVLGIAANEGELADPASKSFAIFCHKVLNM